ncbi:MAG TPA: hypothetical protein VGI66_08355 [Streptosporangiaceae bacterium]
MRFLRQLAAVMAVVAVVVFIGLAWHHSGNGAGPGASHREGWRELLHPSR